MKTTLQLSFFISTFVLALTGCQSILESKEVKYNATIEWQFIQPERDNRIPNEGQPLQWFGQSKALTLDTESDFTYIGLDPQHIVRCDGAVTICRHGITNPTIKYTIKKHGSKNKKLLISGVYRFEIKKSVRRESNIGYVEESISEEFPLLPQKSKSIPFSGVSGNGEVVSVSGPYGTAFKIAIKINDDV
jgi:hypothetical protein